jgi:diguanylate cyclase (GGDEF)-like protein
MESAAILQLPHGTEVVRKPPAIRARPGQRSWLNTLAVISRRLTVAPTAIDAYRDMVDMLAGALDFECITYYEPAPGGETLTLVHAAGNNRDLLDTCTPWPADRGVLGLAFVSGTTVLVNDTSSSPIYVAALPGTNAELAVPLVDEGEVVGVLDIEARHRGFFSPTAVEVVEAIAAQAVVVRRVARLVSRLDELARRDSLTMTANRRSWEEELPKYISRAARDGKALSVAIFDIDHFKDFNDVQGHQRGDLLLREITEAWRGELREGDLLARYGGEEFTVALAGCPLDEAVPIVERLRASTPVGQTCSAGVACWDTQESAEALVARADAALYEAKLTGRNRTVAALPEVGRAMALAHTGTVPASWTQWTGVVPRLLEERSMRSVYQPIVRLDDGFVVGYEALARPMGMAADIGVEGLFAAAQYRGLGRDLDWLCRRTALTCSADMPGGVSLFVNVGVSALLDPLHDVDQMQLLLEHEQRRPQDVVLEITEREAIRDMSRFSDVLARYRDCGFRFAIDDVGEGHSTLEMLAAASPEYIKLARSLMVAARRAGPRSAIRAVVAFARSAGGEVIAEGIETATEARDIRALGVELGQGAHLGIPRLAPDAFCALPRAG